MTNIPGNSFALVDSDALIGLIHEDDALHEKCLAVSTYLTKNNIATIVPYPIILEAATTLAKDKTIQRTDLAARLLKDYALIEEKPTIDMDVSELVANFYKTSTSKKNTPFDHFVLAVAKKNKIKLVFSFDSFYKQNGLTLLKDLL